MVSRSLLLILLSTPAFAQPEADAWVERLKAHYTPHRDLDVSVVAEVPRDLYPHCNSAGKEKRVPFTGDLVFAPWRISASARYGDENVFYKALAITVGRLERDGDVIALWEQASKRPDSGSIPECPSTYAMMAVVQLGRDVIRIDSACDENRALFDYEVADLLELVAPGEKVNAKAVVDFCGTMAIRVVDTATLATLKSKKQKTYGGHTMPDDRDAVRERARTAQPDPVAALARAQKLRKPLDQCVRDHAGRHVVPDKIRITVSPAGTVREIDLGEKPPRKLYRCARWISRDWQFAPQGTEISVELPRR
jgi:hypothetical protein